MRSLPMRIALAVLALAASLVQAADRREERPVDAFKALSLSAPIDVTLVQGERESVVLEGPADVVESLETRVEGGTLVIHMKPAITFSWGRTRATVTARAIEAISVAGSGNVRADALAGEALRVAIAGSGDVRVGRLEAKQLEASIVGSGDIHAAGRVDRVAVRIEGSGDVRAGELEAREVRVSIAGSGDVRYRGTPKLEPSVVGSGRVKPVRG